MSDPIVADSPVTYRAHREVKIADEVWIAVALLHRENPDRDDFTTTEIRERLRRENIAGEERRGVQPHVSLHCVANRPPNPARYRMLVATTAVRRRLYRPGDPCDEKRIGAKITPEPADLPTKYRPLLQWYHELYSRPRPSSKVTDPILSLRGLGKDVWQGEGADAYVRRLRAGWG